MEDKTIELIHKYDEMYEAMSVSRNTADMTAFGDV